MVQTLRKRPEIQTNQASLLIIDEAHLTDFDKTIPRFTNAKRLGLSATPKRAGRLNQLTNFYSKIEDSLYKNCLKKQSIQ
jgi:superfamily II DNA or RNA helicase